ncbi:SDR family oxidoreductase [Alphaproteobacteria bacterium]|nr:SDR family oxidoreductase [Alphaproteobacteria bacterium]
MASKKVLITGAAGAIGQQLAKRFLQKKWQVLLLDKDEKELKALKSGFGTNCQDKCQIFHCDLESEQERSNVLEKLKANTGVLDCLINNAAYVGTSDLQGWNCAFEGQSLDTWRRAIEVNLTAPFHLIRDLAGCLKKSDDGNVVNITSIYAHVAPDWRMYENLDGFGNPAAYSASKGGLIQLTKWASTTLAPEVRVNAVSPGGLFRNQPEIFVQRYEQKTPLKRMADVDDVVNAVLFLSSKSARYITGQSLIVDGGYSVW